MPNKLDPIKLDPIKLDPIKLDPIKLDPKVKPIIKKETYLDNYYSKDFLKQYFI